MKKVISFVFILVFSLFWSFSYCIADENGSKINNDFSTESKPNNIKNNNKRDVPKATSDDIFGDEQTFPFVAGLGKNAAH